MNKYPNKTKRIGFWKVYEQANIKDFRKVWDTALDLVSGSKIPFKFSNLGRKPNLSREEYVCMGIIHVYFNLDFRETENMVGLLTGKSLDHSNCVRGFGRLILSYINELVFKIHSEIS